MTFDIIIKNGRVIDGAGNPWFRADVGIQGEKIKKVGSLHGDKANEIIDVAGLIVCPGFVDLHTHSDLSFLVNSKADSKLTQGITTEMVGNCGNSAAPVTDSGKSFFVRGYEDLGLKWDWNTVAEYMGRLDKMGISLNIATLIGHGTVRASVLGFEARDPTPEELGSMKSLVDAGMKEGAFGLSSGLKYAPGCYAKTDEVVELCKVVQRYRGIYSTHIRNQGDFLIESVDEAIEIGQRSGVPVLISHLKVKMRNNWGKAGNMLRIIDEAREAGVDVTFDQYPYLAGQTNSFAITPGWAREGGVNSFLERLKDPAQRKKIEAEIPEHEDWAGAENILIVQFSPDKSYVGKTLEEIAKLRKKTPASTMCDLLLEANGIVPVLIFHMWETDVRDIMTHHVQIVGSDGSSLAPYGILGRGKPHPRSYGCFTRFLGRYVIKEGLMSLEDGIRRMTSLPAQIAGLADRGLIRENMFADLIVLDPKNVLDIATFEEPHQYSKGIEYVFVNGKMAVEKGKFTGQLAGKALRHRSIIQ